MLAQTDSSRLPAKSWPISVERIRRASGREPVGEENSANIPNAVDRKNHHSMSAVSGLKNMPSERVSMTIAASTNKPVKALDPQAAK